MISNDCHMTVMLHRNLLNSHSHVYASCCRKILAKEMWLMNPCSVSVLHPNSFLNSYIQKHCFHQFLKTFLKSLCMQFNAWMQDEM